MEFERSYELRIEDIAQKYGFSTGTASGFSGNYTVIHNSRYFSHYMFGNWEDERIIQIYFAGSADNPKVDMQQIRVYRDGIEKEIKPFIEEIINELHSGDEKPQGQLVATGVGRDTRWFGRRKMRSTIKSG